MSLLHSKYVLLALAVVLFAVAWMFRYSVSAPNQHGLWTVTDRWTGTAQICGYNTINGHPRCL